MEGRTAPVSTPRREAKGCRRMADSPVCSVAPSSPVRNGQKAHVLQIRTGEWRVGSGEWGVGSGRVKCKHRTGRPRRSLIFEMLKSIELPTVALVRRDPGESPPSEPLDRKSVV